MHVSRYDGEHVGFNFKHPMQKIRPTSTEMNMMEKCISKIFKDMANSEYRDETPLSIVIRKILRSNFRNNSHRRA